MGLSACTGGHPHWAPLFLDTPYHPLVDQGPVLVMSNNSDQWSDYASALLSQSDAGCILYLESAQHWQAAVEHCQSLLSVRTEERPDQLMRFFEPRWMEPLLATLSDGEKQAFMGPFSGCPGATNLAGATRRVTNHGTEQYNNPVGYGWGSSVARRWKKFACAFCHPDGRGLSQRDR